MTVLAAMLVAVCLDAWWGEWSRAHPLVCFGRMAAHIEKRFHADARVAGMLAWALAVLPPTTLCIVLTLGLDHLSPWWSAAWGAGLLYLALGRRSLAEHAQTVADALSREDLPEARCAVGRMVSRDTDALDASQVAAAATESVLENGNDAVLAALFWFAVLGAPGVLLYRLSNTLDAMWGYRTPRYRRFGWAAARIDDVLNVVPARLTALTYAALGHAPRAWRCWRRQASAWDSPNAGPVMAAGAGALGVRLGGPMPYHGVMTSRAALGEGALPDADSITRAVRLVRHGTWLWVLVWAVVIVIGRAFHA